MKKAVVQKINSNINSNIINIHYINQIISNLKGIPTNNYHAKMNNKEAEKIIQLENDYFLSNNFDPMSDHYYSKENSFVPGPSGDFGCILDYNSINLKDKNRIKLYVSNIPEELTDRGLRNIFQSYGDVIESCIRHAESGHKYGFVNYSHLDTAVAAMHGLHLKAPHRFVIKFSDSNIATPAEDIKHEPLKPLIHEITYRDPLLPLVLSDARKKFLNSDFYKSIKEPEKAHNRLIQKLAKKPNDFSKRYLTQRKNISSLSDAEISAPFEVNKEFEYNSCNYCQEPAAYICNISRVYYCSLYCQEKKTAKSV